MEKPSSEAGISLPCSCDGEPSPRVFDPGETARPANYFFLGVCLAAVACFFFWSALLTADCFCVDFFWFDFGDLSPMCLTFFSELTRRRNRCFPAGVGTLLAATWIVNDGAALRREAAAASYLRRGRSPDAGLRWFRSARGGFFWEREGSLGERVVLGRASTAS